MNKKRITAIILIICAVLTIVAAVAACNGAKQLDEPKGFTLDKDNDALVWDAVENAYSYAVYYTIGRDGERRGNQIVKEPKVSLSGIVEQGEYIIYVQALAENDDFKDSKISEYVYKRGNNIATPTGGKVEVKQKEGGKYLSVTWNAVSNAASYTVTVRSKTGDKELVSLNVGSAACELTEFEDKDSSNNVQIKKFAETPDLYYITVRANSSSDEYMNSARYTFEYVVKGTLNTPYITKLEISGENSKRIRWDGNTNSQGVTVEAWRIGDGETKESVLEKAQNNTFDKVTEGNYYSYTPSSKTATTCQISSLNIAKPGEYVLTVTAKGDESGIYDTVGPVSGDAGDIYTVRRLSDVIQATFAVVPQGSDVYAHLDYKTGANRLYDAVKIYVSKSYLEIADTFKIVLTSYNVTSSNSINDISVNINVKPEEGEDGEQTAAGEKKYTVSDTYNGSEIAESGDYIVITYDINKIFHAEEDGEIVHKQSMDSAKSAYGRYFNVSVQASNGKTDSGQKTAYIAGGSKTMDNYYLSYCEPETDEQGRYVIDTAYVKDGDVDTAQIKTFAFAKLMYIQALMLKNDNCSGKTFVIAENIDASGNAWLSLEGFAGSIVSGTAKYTAPDGTTSETEGNYYIRNLVVKNSGAIEYSKKEEDAKTIKSFGKQYGLFTSINETGSIVGVGFINIQLTDSEYKFTYKLEENDKEVDKTDYLYTDYTGALAGINKGRIEDVYVSGEIKSHNYVGGVTGNNVSGATLRAVECSVKITAEHKDENVNAAVGGLVAVNAGDIFASSALGEVSVESDFESSSDKYLAVGGLLGVNATSGRVESSYAECDVKTVSARVNYTGGFVGFNEVGARVVSCYAGAKHSGNIAGSGNAVRGFAAGGFAGKNSGSINTAYSVARVSGDMSDGTGGFAGINDGTIDYAYAAGRTLRGGVELNGDKSMFAGSGTMGLTDCFVQRYISDLSTVNNALLKEHGMSNADGYNTYVLDGVLYPNVREAKVNRNGICDAKAIAAVNDSVATALYTSPDFNLEGYTLDVKISGGMSSFSMSGTVLLKYQLVKDGAIMSSSTIVITVS